MFQQNKSHQKQKVLLITRKKDLSLISQKEVGNAQNARITTSKEEKTATDAKKKRQLKILRESQNT